MLRIKTTGAALARAQAEQILREICAAAGLAVSDDAPVEIIYGEDTFPSGGAQASILIPAAQQLKPPDIKYYEVNGRTIPILYASRTGRGDPADIITADGRTVYVKFDLPLAVWRLLSGLDEKETTARDDHGRVRRRDMPGWYFNASESPVVTHYVNLLINAYETACSAAGIPPVRAARWPGAAPYAVAVSHDVDQLTNYRRRERLRSAIANVARGRRPATLDFVSPERAYKTLPAILKVEGTYGAVPTFFVGAIRRGDLDYNYNVEKARPLITALSAAGAELALHSSYYCDGPYELAEEASALAEVAGTAVKGVRGHYLRVEPERMQLWAEEAGLVYDASLGYFDDVGFRRMHCLPFERFFDDDKLSHVYEVPLTLMDGTLFQYLGLKGEEAVEKALGLLDEVKSAGGLYSVLWHYRAFPGGQFPEWADAFEAILARAAADGACFLSHAEAVDQRKSWAVFNAFVTKRGETADAVLTGAPGTSVVVPAGWSAGDKAVKTLTIPSSGELKVTLKPVK